MSESWGIGQTEHSSLHGTAWQISYRFSLQNRAFFISTGFITVVIKVNKAHYWLWGRWQDIQQTSCYWFSSGKTKYPLAYSQSSCLLLLLIAGWQLAWPISLMFVIYKYHSMLDYVYMWCFKTPWCTVEMQQSMVWNTQIYARKKKKKGSFSISTGWSLNKWQSQSKEYTGHMHITSKYSFSFSS